MPTTPRRIVAPLAAARSNSAWLATGCPMFRMPGHAGDERRQVDGQLLGHLGRGSSSS